MSMNFKDIPQFTRIGTYEVSWEFRYFIEHLQNEIKEGLELNPDFQRGHVWTEEQQIAFIEYFLMGGEVGTLYFNAPNWPDDCKNYVCVDGLQRITAFTKFYNNELQAFGLYYKEYTGRPSNWIKVNVNNLKTRKEVLKWYLEINSGGTPHTKEELDRVRKLLEAEM